MGSNISLSVALDEGHSPNLENYDLTGFEKLASGTFFNATSNIWYGPSGSPRYHQSVSLGEVFLACCNRTLDKVAQINDNNGHRLTYRQLKRQSIRICENLRKIGYKKGDMVMVIARNGHHLSSAIFGCLLLGTPINPMDPTFGQEDLTHMMAITKPKLVFCDASCVDVTRQALNNIAGLQMTEIVTFEKKLSNLRFVEELMAEPVADEESYTPSPLHQANKEPAIIFCSSGTTGKSKAVIISQALLLSKCNEMIATNADDVTLCFSSIYWLSGLIWMVYSALNNTTRVTTNETVTAELALRFVEQYKVTIIFTPPSLMSLLAHCPAIANTDLSSLKSYLCGGSVVSKSLQDKIQPFLPNCSIIVAYGMTELSGVVAVNNPKIREGSVGRLIGNVEVKIVDEQGASLRPGESGEIYIRSLYYFLGYLNNPEATKVTIDSERWIHTGDTGYFDSEGYLFLDGRKKEIIKYCSYQISPADIVDILEKIKGVRTAFATGIPDVDKGDLPAALWVRMDDSSATTDEIVAEYNANSPDYKRLRGGLYMVDQLPMTISGKVSMKEATLLATKLYEERRGLVTIVGNGGKHF